MKLRSAALADIMNEADYVFSEARRGRLARFLWLTARISYRLTRRLYLAALRAANRRAL
jgi:hypothetical protein